MIIVGACERARRPRSQVGPQGSEGIYYRAVPGSAARQCGPAPKGLNIRDRGEALGVMNKFVGF